MKKTLTILIVCYLGTNLFAQTNQHLSTIRQADQLYEQGMNQYKSGNYTAAIQRFDQSLTLEKEFSHESDPRYQNLLMWKAGCLYKQGKIDQAKAVSPDYYLIPPIDRAKTAVADSLALQAQAMLASGNAPKALTILQSEAELEKKIIGAKHVLYANTLRNMADVYLMCGDGKSALPYYQAYKEIIAPVYGTRSKFYAAAINGISAGYTYDSARWNEAAKLHEQAQTIYDSLNIAEQERAYLPAIVLSTPAIDNYKSKNFPKAILLLSIIKDNDLIPEKERLLAKQIYGKANGSVASKLFSKNDYQSSIPYFEKSILYADSAAKAVSSLELGLCYFHLKRYQTARNLFFQTETYAKDEATKQMAYRFIGNAYYYESYPFEASQEYGNALKGYLAALNWFKQGGKPSAYIQALRNVAGIYNNTGEWEKSDSLYQVALQLALTAGDTMGIARTYFDIGCSYLKKNDYNQALKCFDNCYQLCLSIHDYPFALATLSRKVNLYLYNLNNDYMAFMCEKQCEELLKFMDPAQLTTFLPSLFSIQKDM
ncbi:MAG: tetratricopeptide repeat protein, partial [Bacteroidota bacterium]|nr:tetratricopeptide repeat protein [Bacteroidota bacterium]